MKREGDLAPTDAVLEILEELDRAKKKHPDFPRSIVGMVSIMAEEAGEAIREANRIEDDKNGDLNALRTELIQTAAMCVRCLENMNTLTMRESGWNEE
jgi:NTP pyrophosphatase (non-canonical NTP hydrolase)